MSRVYCIGPMGAGKSILARQLSESCNISYRDMDDLIVEKIGSTIKKFVNKYGEAKFRVVESLILDELSVMENIVIATGGGSVLLEKNRTIISDSSCVIYLKTSVKFCATRLESDFGDRFLLDGMETLIDTLNNLQKIREHLYQEIATLTIVTDNLNCDEVYARALTHLQGVARWS